MRGVLFACGMVVLFLLLAVYGSTEVFGARFVIQNQTDYEVRGVYMAAEKSADWGLNLLSSSFLSPKEEEEIPLKQEAGFYNIRLLDIRYASFVLWDVWIEEGVVVTFVPTDLFQGDREYTDQFVLFNETGYEITQVFLVEHGRGEWGENLLAPSQTLKPSGWLIVPADWSTTRYDICFVDEELDPYYRWNVSLADSFLEMTFEDFYRSPITTELVIENKTAEPFSFLYIAKAGEDFGENLLAEGETLLPGAYLDLSFLGVAGEYSLWVVDTKGQSYLRLAEYLSGARWLSVSEEHKKKE